MSELPQLIRNQTLISLEMSELPHLKLHVMEGWTVTEKTLHDMKFERRKYFQTYSQSDFCYSLTLHKMSWM